MIGSIGFREFLFIVVIIIVLSSTGLWPKLIRGLRELRGDATEGAPRTRRADDLCYQMLGLSPSASWEEIERAYRQKAKIHHPDHGGDGDAMRALNEAYAQLKQNPARGMSRSQN